MCLSLKSLTPKYTIEDKVVYKWLMSCHNGDVKSPFMNFVYELDKSYESILIRDVSYLSIKSRYHKNSPAIISVPNFCYSLITGKFYMHHLQPGIANVTYEVSLGFHTFKSIDDAIIYQKCHNGMSCVSLYKCVIPKNSWYYEGEDNELASDHIIIKERIF